jgi:transposase
LRAAEQNPVARAAYWEQTVFLDPARCVFLDETSTAIDFTRRYARALHAARAYGTVPRNHGQRTTLLAVLTPAGLDAPLQLAGALDTETFVAYVEQFLLPMLQPGQIVILDNLSCHHAAAAQELLERAGCRFHFLPSYSPDFNPIELAFSKLKARLRKVAPRTQAALDAALLEAIDAITPADARHWFRHAGYRLPASSAS